MSDLHLDKSYYYDYYLPTMTETIIRYYVSPASTIRGWYVESVVMLGYPELREAKGAFRERYNTKREAKNRALRLNQELQANGQYVGINA